MIFNTLTELIHHVERTYSDPARPLNNGGQSYRFETREELGDCAYLYFQKTNGKKLLVVALKLSWYWVYFLPKFSHLPGLELLKPRLLEVEGFNKKQMGG